MNQPPAEIAFLVGQWHGHGRGEYPTIEPFEYTEEVSFWHTGKPFLWYRQRTVGADGQPLHAETGYLRAPSPGRVEWVLTHPFGVVEVQEGTVEGTRLHLTSTGIVGTSTAKQIDQVERDIDVDGETLTYAVRMAAVGVPLTHHLSARLERV